MKLAMPLQVAEFSAIITYGEWVERFEDYNAVHEYVANAPQTVNDPKTPLHRIKIKVAFSNGDSEQCAYQDRARALAWLERFAPYSN